MTTIKNAIYTVSFILSLGIAGSIETDNIELSLAVSMLVTIACICVLAYLIERSSPYLRELIKALRRRYEKTHKTGRYNIQRV